MQANALYANSSMADALIQIVDEQNRPIGAATKQEAWAKGLYHRVSRIMVDDGHGRIVLQKRAADRLLYPGCWDNSVAGLVDHQETFDDAATRELFEELGIRARLTLVGDYVTRGRSDNKILNRFTKVYSLTIDRGTKLTPEAEAISELRWFTLQEIRELVRNHPDQVTDGLADVIEKYYATTPRSHRVALTPLTAQYNEGYNI